jgi:outer membrane receptor for ferrienterochelin and colicins
MQTKYLTIFITILILSFDLYGQELIKGKVLGDDGNALIGASIQIEGTSTGTIADANGSFALAVKSADLLVVSFVGYFSDTVTVYGKREIEITLQPTSSEMSEVIIRSKSTMIENLEPRMSEVLLESELLKAACCNLSESFETNASVDVSFTDAVSGAKMIQMLGLDGRYVQINRENIPLVRGLSGRYGLGYVPGTWIQSIDVGKGAGSVVNGYESMVGQINLEFKKPLINEKVYLNTYLNSFGRAELNYNQSFKLSDRWSSVLLTHVSTLQNEVDRNKDQFMDVPKGKQINVINRYKYSSKRVSSQVGIQLMRDEKIGGQLGFDFGDDASTSALYGFNNQTTRLEVFGKTGILFPLTPYKGWGFIYSLSYQDIEAAFGRKEYTGQEVTGYVNMIHQNIIVNSFHQYKTGLSMLFDDFDESYNATLRTRTEVVPGAFFEYSYLPSDKLSMVIGNRLDYHNLFDWVYTPRLHLRYQFQPTATLRLSSGKGSRTPNPITENTQFLVSSRALRINEELAQETSWNYGASVVKEFQIAQKSVTILADYFYTNFSNQMIVDLEQNRHEINIANLNGQSFAHSFQIESRMQISEFVELKGAYKYYQVEATMVDQLVRMPYVAQNRFFLNGSYASKYDKWKADLTINWIGEKRLPSIVGHQASRDTDIFSPAFSLINAQVSRGFKWGSVYVGGENLLDFRQPDPIALAQDPFNIDFDASNIWGPIAGRLIYVGLRYRLKY